MLLLSAYLIEYVGNNEVFSAEGNSTEESIEQVEQEQTQWPFPEQERWVKEPVFNGQLHLVESGRTNRQTIILVHGLGYRGLLDWLKVLPALTDKYHVIAIDLPGFGSSDKHQIQYAPQKYAELVSWVVSQFAHDSVIVIGHSMGGAVSLRYAHDYPGQISRLIIVDAAGILQRTVFIKHIAKVPTTYSWLEPYQRRIPGLKGLVEKLVGKTDAWTRSLLVTMDRLPDIPQLMMSNGLAKKYLYKDNATLNAALGLVYEDFSVAVREVNVPTHIVWGDHDTVAPVRTGILLANLMSNAELHVIDNAGHVPMTDNFDEFMNVLTYSLEEIPHAMQAQERLVVVKNQEMVQKNTSCDGQDDLVYTGHYGVIRLRNCRGVVLRDLVAESIEMVSSEVSLENVKLDSPNIGLLVSNSVVTATLLQVDANIGMVVESSYLDLAGVDLVTQDMAVDIRKDSNLYFSLSRNQQGNQKIDLHGVSLGLVFNLY